MRYTDSNAFLNKCRHDTYFNSFEGTCYAVSEVEVCTVVLLPALSLSNYVLEFRRVQDNFQYDFALMLMMMTVLYFWHN